MSTMFTPVWTEVGQCFTFKGPEEEALVATETGRVTHHLSSHSEIMKLDNVSFYGRNAFRNT